MTLRVWRRLGFLVLIAIGVSSGLAACSSSKKDAQQYKPPVTAPIGNPKALFVARPTGVASPAAAASTSSDTKKLHAVDWDETFRTIVFKDEDGKAVDVSVELVEILSKDWVWLRIGYSTEAGNAMPYVLLRVADGKLFSPPELSFGSPQVNGSWFYGIRNDGLLRVDLSSMTVYPMSNPAADLVGLNGAPFVSDQHGNVRAAVYSKGWYSQKIFFADNSPPIVDTWSPNQLCNDSEDFAEMYGVDQHPYALCSRGVPDPDGSTTTSRLEYFVREVSFTATGSVFTDSAPVRTALCAPLCETPIQQERDWTLRPRTRQLLFTTGFFRISPLDAGGLAVSWTDVPLSSVSLLSGDYGYWKSGDTIYRIRLEGGATAEAVVTAPNIISWDVAAGVLVFTRYLTGTSIGTFTVATPGVDPVLASSSDMQIEQVQEF